MLCQTMSKSKLKWDACFISVEVYELRVWRTGLEKMVGQRTVLPWQGAGNIRQRVGEDRLWGEL